MALKKILFLFLTTRVWGKCSLNEYFHSYIQCFVMLSPKIHTKVVVAGVNLFYNNYFVLNIIVCLSVQIYDFY